MKNEGKFHYESVRDAETLKPFLKALSEAFAAGEVRLSMRDEEIVLRPEGLINFVVEAKSKDGRCKLNVKFAWREGASETEEPGDSLTIGSLADPA